MLKRILIACGIASSALYVGATIVGALRWQDYDSASQGVSELSAIGAPTRPLMVSLFIPYSLLLMAFGAGVWQTAGGRRALRVLGGLLVASGVLDLAGPLFPMHPRGEEATFTDTMHITMTALDVLFFLLATGVGAAGLGKRFRVYSVATVALIVLGGALAGLEGGQLAAGQPTPWLGVTERVNIYGAMLWRAVLAVALLRAGGASAPERLGTRAALPEAAGAAAAAGRL